MKRWVKIGCCALLFACGWFTKEIHGEMLDKMDDQSEAVGHFAYGYRYITYTEKHGDITLIVTYDKILNAEKLTVIQK